MKTLLSLAALAALALPAAASPAAAAFTGVGKPFTAKTTNPDGSPYLLAFQGTRGRATRVGAGPLDMVLTDYKTGDTSVVFGDSKEYHSYKGEVDQWFLDPCAVQKKGLAQGAAGLLCEKKGTAVVNGRKTEKYVISMPGNDQTLESFYDPELKVVIKAQGEDGEVHQLTDIKVGAAGGSFEVPKGYKPIDEKQFAARLTQQSKRRKK